MSFEKPLINKKAAAGAVLVALSGFVPQPMMQPAVADSASIDITGSFITGISLTAGQDAQFGSVAATAGTGKIVMATAGTLTPSKAVSVGGTIQAGTVVFKAVNTTPSVDLTVKGLGAVTLGATGGGAGPTGTMLISKLLLGKIAATAVAVTAAGTAKTATVANIDITTTSAKMTVGPTVNWTGGTTPLGSFTQTLTFTMAY